MQKITAIIVDDEQDSRETLRSYVGKYCPQVELIGECANIQEAQAAIEAKQPQLVFLDIEMPYGNAFDLLERLNDIHFEIVFITAFSQYAVQAFQQSAVHYLLKPVNIEELEEAVAKAAERIQQKNQWQHTQVLLENLAAKKPQHRKLVLPLIDGFDVVQLADILYLEAEDNFTCFYFSDGRKSLICRRLKHYEDALSDLGFCRVHRSFMVNLDYVKRYKKGKGGTIILSNDKEIMVSNAKKNAFILQLKNML